ncbi:jerky-like protein [Trichonephila clavipes]|nr:jerky-like protein [Trichonephila clavipes]
MDLLEPNDVVMADKGFLIENELASVGCKLQFPAFLRDKIQFDVSEMAQKSAGMTSDFFSDWYSKDFLPGFKKLREREGETGKVLLILDNAPCHPPVESVAAFSEKLKMKVVCYMLAEAWDSFKNRA